MRNVLAVGPPTEVHGITLYNTQLLGEAGVRDRDVLDIGCGFGWFEVFALAHGVRSVVGIEPTERDIATAREHIDAPNARFEVASALDLPFNDASFDTVICCEVLEHIPKGTEPQAFKEIQRVLRPGGALYLSTPHAALASRVLDPAWWLIRHRHYTPARLRVLAQNAGLSVQRLEVRGGLWQMTSMLNLYVAKWIFRRGPFYEDAFNRRVDAEITGGPGFAGCFMQCRA